MGLLALALALPLGSAAAAALLGRAQRAATLVGSTRMARAASSGMIGR